MTRHSKTAWPSSYPGVEETIFSVSEAAAKTGIPGYHIRRWLSAGRLPMTNPERPPHGLYRFRAKDLFLLLVHPDCREYPQAIPRVVQHLRVGELPRSVLLAYVLGEV